MKKNIFLSVAVIAFALVAMSFTTKADAPSTGENNGMTKITITTDENGNIATAESSDANYDNSAWHIRDLSGYTNIRNKPNGKVCMRLKAHTQYDIYTTSYRNGWLLISSIYNLREGYWVRLHSSSTGQYWIARSILY